MTIDEKKRQLALKREQVEPFLNQAEKFIGAVRDYLKNIERI
jgi:hypothetical protein